MTEEKQLTLEEMLALAEKVENWKNSCGSLLEGSLKSIDIKIGYYPSGKLSQRAYDYQIIIKHQSKDIILSELRINSEKEEGKKVGQIYDIAMRQSRENERNKKKRVIENQQKAREDALKYIRDLLNN